jgi:homocysteine S-methyltransferase
MLADGAMGTQLYARGIAFDQNFDELNLSDPKLVGKIHRDYLAAGAELIETNTFGANRMRLSAFGHEDRVRLIARQGARVARDAREVMGAPAFVIGSMGPLGKPLEPYGTIALADAHAMFKEAVEGLLEGGVDGFMLETFGDLAELLVALAEVRAACALPAGALLTFGEDGPHVLRPPPRRRLPRARRRRRRHRRHELLGRAAGHARRRGRVRRRARRAAGGREVRAVDRGDAQRRAAAAGRRPLRLHGHARVLRELRAPLRRGRRPARRRLLRHDARARRRDARAARPRGRRGGAGRPSARPRRTAGPSPSPRPALASAEGEPVILRKIREKFLVSVELDPPRGINPQKILAGAKLLAERGVDAVNVADSPMARVRMSAQALTYLVMRHYPSFETILHFTCRDRNLMGHPGRPPGRARDGTAHDPGPDGRSAERGRLPERHRRSTTSTRSASSA